MKTYTAKILTSAKIDWSSLPTAEIASFPWENERVPKAYAQAAYVKTGDESEGLYAHLWCFDDNPRAIYTQHNEPVFKDSCLEFFFSFNKSGAQRNPYVNIESNSNPTTLIGFGFDRYGRVPIVDMGIEPFKVTAVKSEGRWDIYEFVPFSVIRQLFHLDSVDETTELWANFYKCAGEDAGEHYGSWAEIVTEKPDFHRPECFGRLVLE